MGDRFLCISVRMSPAEQQRLDAERAGCPRGKYLRDVWLRKPLPPVIPDLNREAWQELSKAAGNLNQIARACNCGDVPELPVLRDELGAFRAALIAATGTEPILSAFCAKLATSAATQEWCAEVQAAMVMR